MLQLKNLPEPIAAYFEVEKRGGDAVAHCFTREGVVADEGKTHRGPEAIKAWMTAASTKYSFTNEPLGIDHRNGRYIVTSRVMGNFPGSPIDLRYIFTLERGKIASLEIAP